MIFLILQMFGLGVLLTWAQQAAGGEGGPIAGMLASQGALGCFGVLSFVNDSFNSPSVAM